MIGDVRPRVLLALVALANTLSFLVRITAIENDQGS